MVEHTVFFNKCVISDTNLYGNFYTLGAYYYLFAFVGQILQHPVSIYTHAVSTKFLSIRKWRYFVPAF